MLHRLRTAFPRAGTPRGCRRPWFWVRVLAATAALGIGGVWEPAAQPAGECPSLRFPKPPELRKRMGRGRRRPRQLHHVRGRERDLHRAPVKKADGGSEGDTDGDAAAEHRSDGGHGPK